MLGPCCLPPGRLRVFLGNACQDTLLEMGRWRYLFWSKEQHRGDFPRLAQRALTLCAVFQVPLDLYGSLIFQDAQRIGIKLVFDVLIWLERCISHESICLNALRQQELFEPLHTNANTAFDRAKWVA